MESQPSNMDCCEATSIYLQGVVPRQHICKEERAIMVSSGIVFRARQGVEKFHARVWDSALSGVDHRSGHTGGTDLSD